MMTPFCGELVYQCFREISSIHLQGEMTDSRPCQHIFIIIFYSPMVKYLSMKCTIWYSIDNTILNLTV